MHESSGHVHAGHDDPGHVARFRREALRLGLPLILVVGLRLGCLNHALLTAEAVRARGLRLAGWVANQVDARMACVEENVDTLRARIDAPLLGFVRYQTTHNLAPVAALLALPA